MKNFKIFLTALIALGLAGCSTMIGDLSRIAAGGSGTKYTVVHMQESIPLYDASGNQVNESGDVIINADGSLVYDPVQAVDAEGNPVYEEDGTTPVYEMEEDGVTPKKVARELSYDVKENEVLKGTPGELTKAVAKKYAGFTALAFEQTVIKEDGSTEVVIKYNRDEVTIKFDLDGGFWNYAAKKAGTETGDSDPLIMTRKAGTKISDSDWRDFSKVDKTASSFAGWLKNDNSNAETPAEGGSKDDPAYIIALVKVYPTENVTYKAKWDSTPGIPYGIEFYEENLDSTNADNLSNYTKTSEIEQTAADAPQVEEEGDTTDFVAPEKTGFTARTISQKVINSSMTAEERKVKVYYQRNICKVTLKSGDGVWDFGGSETTADKVFTGKFGTEIDYLGAPATLGKKSYEFDKWQVGETAETVTALPANFAEAELGEGSSYTAVFKKCAEVNYKVAHMFERSGVAGDPDTAVEANWEKNEELAATETKSGVPEEETAAEAKTITGYTALTPVQAEIARDGNTVVKVFYKRNAVTVTFDIGEGMWNYTQWKADHSKAQDTTPRTESGKYGNLISYAGIDKDNSGKLSCVFDGVMANGTKLTDWPATFPAADTTYVVKWAEKDSVNYSVQHWFEKTDAASLAENESNYDLRDSLTESLQGKPDTDTNAVAKTDQTGFTSRPFSQQEILGSGATVVKIYYTRNAAKITLDPNGGTWNYAAARGGASAQTGAVEITGKFGQTINYTTATIATLGKKSSNMTGWKDGTADAELPETFPAEEKTYTAQWATKAKVNYTVEHWFEKKNAADASVKTAANYEINDGYTQVLQEIPEEMTNATARDETGFTADAVTNVEVTEDGLAKVKIFYTRNPVTITLKVGDGYWNYKEYKADPANVTPDTADKTISGKFGQDVSYASVDFTQAGKKSCALQTWNDGTSVITALENHSPVATFPAADTAYTAIWTELASVKYTVEYWLEKTTSTDSSVLSNYSKDSSVELEGKPETATNAVAEPKTGFTSKEFQQAEIAANGSTVVKIYYARNVYELTFNTDDGLWNYDAYKADPAHVTPVSEAKTISGKFGSTVDYATLLGNFATLKKLGKDLSGWNKGTNALTVIATDALPATFPASNDSYTAVWTTKAAVSYKVNFMTENLDSASSDDPSNYTLHSTDTTKKGVPEYNTEAVAKAIPGFDAKAIEQVEIKADGTTEVNVYYVRKTVKVTFSPNTGYWNYATKTGTDPIVREGKYEAAFTVPSTTNIGKTAHDFQGWTIDGIEIIDPVPATFPAEDVTYLASWKQGAGIKYNIRHYQQNTANDQYTLFETTEGIGTKETETEAVALTYTGFTAQPVTQKTIGTKDGDTTVDIYYNRNTITFTFDANGGTGGKTVTGRYGAAFNAGDEPTVTKAKYTFGGWNTYGGTVDATFEADKTFTAYWASTIQVGDLTHTTDISISATTTADQTTCTVTLPTGYESDTWSYKWYVDGVYNGDDVKTFTRTKAQLKIGVHTITVRAVANGTVYTKQYTATFE